MQSIFQTKKVKHSEALASLAPVIQNCHSTLLQRLVSTPRKANARFNFRLSTRHLSEIAVMAILSVLVFAAPALAQYGQQGPKLVGTGFNGYPQQGRSIALSADGNTAVIGAPNDSGGVGAVWVFTRTGTTWAQQGEKLVGTGAASPANQGNSVGLSGDGNTLVVGGPLDNGGIGAVWIFVRSGGSWFQKGEKLVGTGAVGAAYQGWSVAISFEGADVIVGGPADNSNSGAAWTFTYDGISWVQLTNKLVGGGAVGPARQGSSVALSLDGSTAAVGGAADWSNVGAIWVYDRIGSTSWTAGTKLTGTGADSSSVLGTSAALSGDGNTLITGGPGTGGGVGASWIFTRGGAVWAQQGPKLVGTGGLGKSSQGASVALSNDGNTAIVGGPEDIDAVTGDGLGAVWVFLRTGTVWSQSGNKFVGSAAVMNSKQGKSVAASFDASMFVSGGFADNNGFGAAWVFVWPTLFVGTEGNGSVVSNPVGVNCHQNIGNCIVKFNYGSNVVLTPVPDPGWVFSKWFLGDCTGTGVCSLSLTGSFASASAMFKLNSSKHDFNADGKSDILWRHSAGSVAGWLMNGTTIATSTGIGAADTSWQIVGQGDFDGDGKSDVLWRHTGGSVAMWLMNGTTISISTGVGAADTAWTIAGVGDFNGDGKSDILWRHTGGSVAVWLMNGTTISASTGVGAADTAWRVARIGDFDGDGKSDVLWRHSGGSVAAWLMNGTSISTSAGIGAADTSWTIARTGDFNGDGKSDILWRHTGGSVAVWLMNGTTISTSTGIGAADTAWSIASSGDFDGDGKSDVLWRHTGGSVAVWLMNGTTIATSTGVGAADPSWVIQGVNAD